jgi:hypothetical protein
MHIGEGDRHINARRRRRQILRSIWERETDSSLGWERRQPHLLCTGDENSSTRCQSYTRYSLVSVDPNVLHTCDKLMSSYRGLTEASNGYHVVKIMARLVSTRKAVWIVWKTTRNVQPYFVRLLTTGMYPAIVRFPVSASLFGKSLAVKESASPIRYSISCWLNLKHRA